PIDPYKTMISTSPHVFIESVEDVTETASIKPLPPNENNSLNPTNTALIATPIKIILRGLSPDFQDRVKTRKNARAPPRKANNGAEKNNVGKKVTITIVINPAPEETPIIPGSASGFRMTACNNTPDTAKAAPANKDIIIRGNRKSLIIATLLSVPVNSHFINSIDVISILPVLAA